MTAFSLNVIPGLIKKVSNPDIKLPPKRTNKDIFKKIDLSKINKIVINTPNVIIIQPNAE